MENHDKYIEHNPLYFIYLKKKMKLMGETPIYNIKKKNLKIYIAITSYKISYVSFE